MTSKYQLPNLFHRLASQQNSNVKHFIALREKKQHRLDHGSVMIQGFKTVQEVRDQGIQFKSMIVTAKKDLNTETDIQSPSLQVIKHPELFPAQQYYVTDINLARRILGTASKPGNHDIFAEAIIPRIKDDAQIFSHDRILVFDRISDPGNLGTLVRTAKALGWQSGLITHHSCDLYNDKCIRASRGTSLTWPHLTVNADQVLGQLKAEGYTPIVADMLPRNSATVEMWSPENQANAVPGTGVWFWNQPRSLLPSIKKIALVLSSEHHGVDDAFSNELRVSLPMDPSVESLNVANAGSILMFDLNRLTLPKQVHGMGYK
ncbi:RRNA methyltransferase [Mucor ambiguus]|uniref:rRNA methyltransferase n=1 Tax=Mucor ambiguus TaxID=91626 RepID=A0A0C9MVB4_9FUNG|nr:RRNA methyltransferase [Mucor ambiguus]